MLTVSQGGKLIAEAWRAMALMGIQGEDLVCFRKQKHKEKLF